MREPLILSASEPQGRALLELEAPAEVVVGEQVHVRVTIALAQPFLEQELIQPFRARLDVPVQLEVPWLQKDGVGAPESGPTLVVNGEVDRARSVEDRVEGETVYRVFELERTLSTDQVGHLVLAPTVLRYAHATRFRDDLLQGRVAEDRTDGSVEVAAWTVAVLDPPTEGRPPDYTGAVGSFTLHASVDPTTLALGQSLKLVLTIEGGGNLSSIEPPHLDDLEGLHLRGMLEGSRAGARVLTYDLAPRSAEVREVPSVRLAYFEPGGGYRVARSEAVAIRVQPSPEREPDPSAASTLLIAGIAFAALVVIAALVGRLSRRG